MHDIIDKWCEKELDYIQFMTSLKRSMAQVGGGDAIGCRVFGTLIEHRCHMLDALFERINAAKEEQP